MTTTSDSRASRRMFLAAGAAIAATAATSGSAVASSSGTPVVTTPPPADDPKVFLSYTQAQLDAAYDQSVWASNSKEVIASYAQQSAEVQKLYPPRSYKYGPTAAETLDVYATSTSNAPIVIFIHGGAWRGLSKKDSAFPAPTFVDRGMCFIALDFALIPQVRLPEMAAQIRRAISWVHDNARKFGGDRKNIHVVGHSSGAHLAATMLTTNWRRLGVPGNVIKTGTCLSGMYDLYPVMLSSRSSYVEISDKERDELSPILHLDRIDCPVMIVHGDEESPKFIRQSQAFGAALREQSPRFMTLDGINHFEVASELGDPSSPLSLAVLEHIKTA